MSTRNLVKVLTITKNTDLQIYKSKNRYRGVICFRNHLGEFVEIIKIQGRFKSIQILRREVGLLLERRPSTSTNHSWLPPAHSSYYFEHFRARKAEWDFNFPEFFYLKGIMSHTWPHLLVSDERKQDYSGYLPEEEQDEDEEEEFSESVVKDV